MCMYVFIYTYVCAFEYKYVCAFEYTHVYTFFTYLWRHRKFLNLFGPIFSGLVTSCLGPNESYFVVVDSFSLYFYVT